MGLLVIVLTIDTSFKFGGRLRIDILRGVSRVDSQETLIEDPVN